LAGFKARAVSLSQGNSMPPPVQRILFICTNNSARSQLAEGLLRHDGGGCFEVFSAGTLPTRVNPFAAAALRQAGIDPSGQRSKSVDEFRNQEFDYVVTVCSNAQATCPFFPGGREYLHLEFDDPSAVQGTDEEKQAAFARTRDEIRVWIRRTFIEREI